MIEKFKEPKELAYTIGSNIVVNGVDIYREMSAAYTNYYAKEYEAFGRDLGVSIALVFIGASNAAKLDPGAAKVMQSMAEMQLYPELTSDIYQSGDRKKYVDFLYHIAQTENPTETVPNLNMQLMNLYQPQAIQYQQPQPQLINLANIQPIQLDQQTYMNLINLLSQQQQGAYLH